MAESELSARTLLRCVSASFRFSVNLFADNVAPNWEYLIRDPTRNQARRLHLRNHCQNPTSEPILLKQTWREWHFLEHVMSVSSKANMACEVITSRFQTQSLLGESHQDMSVASFTSSSTWAAT